MKFIKRTFKIVHVMMIFSVLIPYMLSALIVCLFFYFISKKDICIIYDNFMNFAIKIIDVRLNK